MIDGQRRIRKEGLVEFFFNAFHEIVDIFLFFY